MKKLLSILKIQQGEGTKVLIFAVLAALLQAGLAIGISTADALFLDSVGADELPVIYMITAGVMLLYVPFFAYLMEKFGIDRLFEITLGILVLGGIVLYVALSSEFGLYASEEPPVIVYYIAKLYAALWYIAQYTLLWSFADCYFHILDAKRLYCFLSGGMAFGAMIGGMLVTLLVTHIEVQQLFLVWSFLSLAVFPVLFWLRKKCTKLSDEDASEDNDNISIKEQVARVVHVLRTSRYVKFMILTSLCTLVITTLCEYQYMQIFQENRSEAEIAMLFGKLYFFVNIFNLVVNILLFNRLVALIGVRNTALIQPVVYAITFSYLLLHSSFGAALVAFFAFQGILTSIEYNNQNFLFNAFPTREKAQVRTFVEGLCEPLSAAAAGFFLLIYSQRISPQFISVIGLAGAGLSLCAVLGLRSHYLKAMVDNLKKAWLSFSMTTPAVLSNLDRDNQTTLESIAESENKVHALSAIKIMWLNNREKAVDALLHYLSTSGKKDQRTAKELFSDILEDQDSAIFRKTLIWLDMEKSHLDAGILEICGRHNLLSPEDIRTLSDVDELDKRTAAAVARWQSWHLDDALEMLQVMHTFSEGKEEERIAALHIIGESKQPRYVHFVAEHLSDPAPTVRRKALEVIAKLADSTSIAVIPEIIDALADAEAETRNAGFQALRAISDPSCIRPLIDMAPTFPSCTRRNVEDIIQDIGLSSVPFLAALVRSENYPHMNKVIAARALGSISFPQFEVLAPGMIKSGIKSAYDYLAAHWSLLNSESTSNSIKLLTELQLDISESMTEFVLELLTISGKLPDFKMLASSLRSNDEKERANAIETIEQGCTREVFHLLLPLVDSSPLKDKIKFYKKTYRVKEDITADQAIESGMTSPIAIESAFAIHAAWEQSEKNSFILNRKEICDVMQKQLTCNSNEILEDVIFSLLAKDSDSDVTTLADRMNAADMTFMLAESDFFNTLSLLEMEHIITGTTAIRSSGEAIYNKGDVCDAVYVADQGTVLQQGRNKQTPNTPTLIGSEAITGSSGYSDNLIAESGTILKVPVEQIFKASEIYPQVAINLFAQKLGINKQESILA